MTSNPMPKIGFKEKAYIASIAIMVMAVLFFALELLRPACGQLFSVAYGATCPVGTTATFNDSVGIEGGTAFTLTIDEQEFESDTTSPGFVFDGQGVTSAGGQRIFELQQAGTTKLYVNHDGSIQFEDNAAITNGSAAGDMELSPTSNVAITAGSLGEATGTMGLVFEDGTALSAMASNTAGIYANDVAGTVEMFAIDEAGNQTQISPHPASALTQSAACTIPFFYDSTNVYTGTKTNIDWCLVIQDLQSLTSNTYITETQIPANQVRDWWADQAANKAECITIGRGACIEKTPPQYLIDAGVKAVRP